MTAKRQIVYVPITELKRNPRNARRHSSAQIDAIAKSMAAFGMNAPLLAKKDRTLIAGHGRLEAAERLGLEEVPVIFLDHLTDEQAKAYAIADNQLTDRSDWNERELALQLKELSDLALDFEIECTGFELPEIDLRIQSLDEPKEPDDADAFAIAEGAAVSRLGDLWHLGDHRLLCGNALDSAAYETLLQGQSVKAVFTDPPYNVKIDGHVSGLGKVKHAEFAMASGEMTPAGFTAFLADAFRLSVATTVPGAIIYACMDFRHMREILDAAQANALELLNLCVWNKTNGGMGSFYRSKHELVFVLRAGQSPHTNNIQLGRFGRNRTNVWDYAGANVRPNKSGEDVLSLHPTVKPVPLVADALRDCTARGEIVLDPFLGSGTTLLAAHRTGRRARGIELEPRYVDTAIMRWQSLTGEVAKHSNGQTFEQVMAARGCGHDRQ